MSDFMEVLLVVLLVMFLILVACCPFMAAAMYVDYRTCANKAALYKLEFTWGPLIDCQMNVKGKWIPFDQYRAFEQIDRNQSGNTP